MADEGQMAMLWKYVEPENVVTLVGLFTLAFLLLRWITFKCVFIPIGVSSGIDDAKTLSKFCESSIRVLYYLPAWFWGANMGLTNRWIQDTTNCWRGFPNQPVSQELYLYYEMQFGFYIFLVITLNNNRDRKDFWQMLTHHIVSLFLIGVSFWLRYFRMGVVVFFCMDLCDVFLELAKAFNYLKIDRLSNLFFGSLVFCWLIFRILFFPFLVIYPVFYDVSRVHDEDGYTGFTDTDWWFFNSSLMLLQVLQYYWFYLVIMVAVNVMNHGHETIREQIDHVDETLSVGPTKNFSSSNSTNQSEPSKLKTKPKEKQT